MKNKEDTSGNIEPIECPHCGDTSIYTDEPAELGSNDTIDQVFKCNECEGRWVVVYDAVATYLL